MCFLCMFLSLKNSIRWTWWNKYAVWLLWIDDWIWNPSQVYYKMCVCIFNDHRATGVRLFAFTFKYRLQSVVVIVVTRSFIFQHEKSMNAITPFVIILSMKCYFKPDISLWRNRTSTPYWNCLDLINSTVHNSTFNIYRFFIVFGFIFSVNKLLNTESKPTSVYVLTPRILVIKNSSRIEPVLLLVGRLYFAVFKYNYRNYVSFAYKLNLINSVFF